MQRHFTANGESRDFLNHGMELGTPYCKPQKQLCKRSTQLSHVYLLVSLLLSLLKDGKSQMIVNRNCRFSRASFSPWVDHSRSILGELEWSVVPRSARVETEMAHRKKVTAQPTPGKSSCTSWVISRCWGYEKFCTLQKLMRIVHL